MTETAVPSTGAGATSAAAPASVAPPVLPFEIVQRHDVSAGSGARRLELRVELRQWPVTLDQVTAVATRVVESLRGQGWQALAIRTMYDRREVVPSFAALEWAPGGRWEDAASGDAATWAGYTLHVSTAQRKLTQPGSCTLPAEQAYQLNDEYNRAIDRDPAADESMVLADIAGRHGLSTSAVETLVVAVETWTMC